MTTPTVATRNQAPPGLALVSIPDAPAHRCEQARGFCLAVIKQVYGTDYRADWHADLDSLVGDEDQSWFSRRNRGAFWALEDSDGSIVATAGLYRLERKPGLIAAFADRYPKPQDVTQLVRVYVSEDHRGRGIGGWLHTLAEEEAARLAFATLYLHANTDTPATISFWQGRGFRAFASGDGTTHFDKPVVQAYRLGQAPEQRA